MSDSNDNGTDYKIFDGAFIFLCILAALTGVTAVWLEGPSALRIAASTVAADAIFILPQVILGVVVGALFTMLVPRELVVRFLGRQSGIKGILLASFLGTVMPGGPFASFPIVLALGRSGAGLGPLITFLIAWAAVGLNRLLIWEIPFMGVEFAALRFLSSLPLPILAGIFANALVSRFPILRIDWKDK